MRPVREITGEEENFRVEPMGSALPARFMVCRRDSVEPEPVGTYVAIVFRVTGYDPDCDGSLMARLAQVDRTGAESGWQTSHLGLYPDSDMVLDSPGELWDVAAALDANYSKHGEMGAEVAKLRGIVAHHEREIESRNESIDTICTERGRAEQVAVALADVLNATGYGVPADMYPDIADYRGTLAELKADDE